MSIECPKNVIYCTSAEQKMHSKNVAKTYRYGTPKLREVLREKCRVRIKSARQQAFDAARGIKLDGAAAIETDIDISTMLRAELAELEHDLVLQDEIYNELVADFNDWYTTIWEQDESYLIELEASPSHGVLCPFCMQSILCGSSNKNASYSYKCTCGIQFGYAGDMLQLQGALEQIFDRHGLNCRLPLHFFVEPKAEASAVSEQCLSAICETCDYFCSL